MCFFNRIKLRSSYLVNEQVAKRAPKQAPQQTPQQSCRDELQG